MSGDRRCFVSHFVICLALIVGVAFALYRGEPQVIWASDLSGMTSLIAGLVAFAALYVGWQCWSGSSASSFMVAEYLAVTSPMLGLFGTTQGLRLNVQTIAAGSSGLLPLATGFSCTQIGILGAVVIGLFILNLRSGIRRALKGEMVALADGEEQ